MAANNCDQRLGATSPAPSPVTAWRPPLDSISTGAASDEQIDSLNAQAERCRRLAEATYNREVSEMLGTMAEGYAQTAQELARSRRL